jgi:hypothetical protein
MTGKEKILILSDAFMSKGMKQWHNIHTHDNTIKAMQSLCRKLGNTGADQLFTAGNLET